MKIISNKANHVAVVFRMPKNKKIPTENSMADKTIPPNKGKKEGNQEAIPNASQIILDLILETQRINRLRKSGKDERCRQKKATHIRHYLLNNM